MAEKTIFIYLTLPEFSKVKELADAEGVSISQYIKTQIIPNEFNLKYKELLKKVDELKSGEEFTIKKLWNTDEWESITRGVKLSLGKHFYRNVETNNIKNVDIKGFGKAGIMVYVKK